MIDRKHNAKSCWLIGSTAIMLVLFFRGQHLLGQSTGILYATIVFAIALIGYRNLYVQAPSSIVIVLYSIFATVSVAIMFSPATFSPDVQRFIDKQATDRNVRAELTTLIGANTDYTDIVIETKHLKVVFVSISGTVPSRPAIDQLLADLSRLEFVRYCSLRGRVIARDTGVVHEFSHNDFNIDTS